MTREQTPRFWRDFPAVPTLTVIFALFWPAAVAHGTALTVLLVINFVVVGACVLTNFAARRAAGKRRAP